MTVRPLFPFSRASYFLLVGVFGESYGAELRLMDFITAELAGSFIVWAASREAEFLKGKLVWSNWDVDELKGRAEEIKNSKMFTMTLEGWPSK
jgi:hypothetical protein